MRAHKIKVEGFLRKWLGETETPDFIPGGLSSGESLEGLDPYELALGAAVEREHTSDPRIAVEIAADHLIGEDPHYYTKLLKAGL